MYFGIRRHINRFLLDQKLFLVLLITGALTLTMDMLMSLCEGMPGGAVHVAYTGITACYYTLNPLVCALWYFYVDFYIDRSRKHLKKMFVPIMIPVCVTMILAVASAFGNFLFTIGADNDYSRGRFFFVMVAMGFLILAHTVAYTIKNRKKLSGREYATLLLFPIPPTVGAAAQTLDYGISLLWPCTTISLLMLFIYIQNAQLNTDYLTDLYNRRQLDDYLHSKVQNSGSREIAGIMIDVDDFKAINDTYGHDCGDQALKDVAGILKETFRRGDFVARYGGDEFVVVVALENRSDLQKAVNRLKENVERFNAWKTAPYAISLSVGFDYFSSNNEDAADFLRHIDSLMYRDKQKAKAMDQ